VGVAAAAAKKSKLEHANAAVAAAVGATNPPSLPKHESQKPVKKQGGGKQGPVGSKVG
jgi:hypothetical protein